MCQILIFPLILCLLCVPVLGDYYVLIMSNGPVVQGAEITFTAKLFTSSGKEPSGTFEFIWEDNGIPSHERKETTKNSMDKFTVSYNPEHYPPGHYNMQVEVRECMIICWTITSNRIDFNITAKLNGQMNLIQDQKIRQTQYISNATMVNHEIVLSPSDYLYLKNNATSILTYWFIDCNYYGMTSNFTFNFKYGPPDSQHIVEALIVAGFEPITTPAPTTTTTTTTTTPATTTTTSTTTPSTTTSKIPPKINTNVEVNTSNTIRKNTVKRHAPEMLFLNGSFVTLGDNNSFPYVCLNQTNIAPDPKKTYGYFSRTMTVKAPVNNISVTGNNWLQHGDMLSLDIKCTGSASFKYCINFVIGLHNITGNETCNNEPDILNVCEFSIWHYYQIPGEYTVLIIVENDVSKLTYPVTVNVYKVTKRPQLSVIVVPVSFSLVAVVLIVFGMAYYIQNRRRFTVEVANFDFGQKYTDMEYKTFRERLRDSITNALTRAPNTEQSDAPNWPTSSRKYGSMT